jgi:hypothetical protein
VPYAEAELVRLAAELAAALAGLRP